MLTPSVENRVCLIAQANSAHQRPREKIKMNAKELADKFNAKTGAAAVERQRQSGLAAEHIQKRSEILCKRAMERNGAQCAAVPGGTEAAFGAMVNSPLRHRSTYRITSRSVSHSRLVMEEQRAYQRRSETS
jgi:hypothetical protein